VISLVVVMVALAVQALAYGFAGGTGQPNDPYRIGTADELVSIGSDPNLLAKCFVLVADIDLTGQVFSTAIIAPDTDPRTGFDGAAFTGRFDGRGYKITGLTIDASKSENGFLGLFGRVGDGGQVVHVGLEGVVISGGRHARWVGGLAGDNSGLLCRCDIAGSVSVGDWSQDVGGLVGANKGTVSQCDTTADVSVGQYGGVAGLAGSNAGVISQCYAAGNVSAGQYSNLAGLAGSNSGVLSQCYTVAGLAKPTFSTRAGLALSNTGLIDHCYFLRAADGGGPDNGWGIPLSSEQMRQADRLVGWDFYSPDGAGRAGAWLIPEQGFPVLAWRTQASGLVWLPQVKGASLAEAQTMLEKAGLVFGNASYDFDIAVPADKVIGLDPGCPVAKGAVVDVLVSLGVCDWKQNAGDGTKAKPYEVSSAGQLECLGQDRQLWSKSFVLTDDIELTGRLYGDAVIASYPNEGKIGFSGTLDGRGYHIVGLTIASASDYVGLFGYTSAGEVRGLRLTDACVLGRSTLDALGGTGVLAGVNNGSVIDCSASGSVTGSRQVGGLVGRKYTGAIRRSFAEGSVSGNVRVGGLAGYVYSSSSSISECSAEGDVCGNSMVGGFAGVAYGTVNSCFATGNVCGDSSLGGLAGTAYGSISQCFATGDVSGKDNLGGLVGYAYSTSSTSQSFAVGNVSGNKNLGGLVGTIDRATVTQCYATGSVAGIEGLGGLAGNASAGTIRECYAAGPVSGTKSVGGLVGIRTGDTTACFWDTQTSGQAISVGGTGLTTAQMKTAATFMDAGWDFAKVWLICGYPHFQWEAVECGGN
jgi:hypothetical protein